MPSLREILDAQKQAKEKSNAAPILRSETVETTARPTLQKNETLPAEGSKTNGAILPASSGTETPGNSVVEQGPPAGLSPFQLLQWKKKNANKTTNAVHTETIREPVQSDAKTGLDEQRSGGVVSENGIPDNSVASTSASQTADAQKTNDGQIDVEALRADLTYLANNIEQKEIVGQIVRKIAQQLRQSPELTPYMKDADVDLLVRGLRSSYAVAAIKRTEKKETGKVKSAMDNELAGAFAAAGLSLD